MYEFIVWDVEEGIMMEHLYLTYEKCVARRAYVHRFYRFEVDVTITPVPNTNAA